MKHIQSMMKDLPHKSYLILNELLFQFFLVSIIGIYLIP